VVEIFAESSTTAPSMMRWTSQPRAHSHKRMPIIHACRRHRIVSVLARRRGISLHIRPSFHKTPEGAFCCYPLDAKNNRGRKYLEVFLANQDKLLPRPWWMRDKDEGPETTRRLINQSCPLFQLCWSTRKSIPGPQGRPGIVNIAAQLWPLACPCLGHHVAFRTVRSVSYPITVRRMVAFRYTPLFAQFGRSRLFLLSQPGRVSIRYCQTPGLFLLCFSRRRLDAESPIPCVVRLSQRGGSGPLRSETHLQIQELTRSGTVRNSDIVWTLIRTQLAGGLAIDLAEKVTREYLPCPGLDVRMQGRRKAWDLQHLPILRQ
jgi:hypothetical protein